MNTDALTDLLNQILPDAKIKEDLWKSLQDLKENHTYVIEFDDKTLYVPDTAEVHVIVKTFTYDVYGTRCGTYYVSLGIGELVVPSTGILTAQYCFAELWYNASCEVIDVDASEDYLSL